MKAWIVLSIVAGLALVAVPAFAQDANAGGGGGGASAGGGGGGGGGGNTTTYDFEDDLVTGDLVRPDGELLNVRRRGARSSLIRIREHFVPEMLKSVENL